MNAIERAAAFYLGREYDPDLGQVLPDAPVMYDARDLTTHAVCVGMTGSGKTGLGVDLLEEATLDGVPSIIIDPKGDMTNLLLTFPDLAPSDFEPWVNVDDARRKGQSVSQYAAAIAKTWSQGLAEWGQSGDRIRRLRESAQFLIYTPGSDAGIPVSVLQTLKAPAASWDDEEESLRELIAGTVSALLSLVGVAADPVRSREHILLSHILEHAWRRGQDMDLAGLIEAIQRPPVRKLGVFDVGTFYPDKDRFELAMRLNSVVASPSFENWLEGPPLDIARLIRGPEGKPRVSVFYIAHLSDAERMFFVTLLLEQVLTWMRGLSGTTSLRCLLYFDEVFGYFPPHPANPPSKRPLLTLFKTARAFGLGVMVATQNPVDLDYKGLTNAGTWLIGKLQTDRDKARLLEGMESVVPESGTTLDRAYLDRLISSLDSRVFILHNVHEERPTVFKTRWALSYLRGPLTRRQVRTLMKPVKPTIAPQPRLAQAQRPEAQPVPTGALQTQDTLPGYTPARPRVNARVAQHFLRVAISQPQVASDLSRTSGQNLRVRSSQLVYEPYLLGLASVLYADARQAGVKEEMVGCLMPLPGPHQVAGWGEHAAEELTPEELETTPYPEALFAPLSEGMNESPPYTRFRDDFVGHIHRDRSIAIWVHPELDLRSRLDESEREFKTRCRETARQRRDEELSQVEKRFDRDLERLRTRLEREEHELDRDEVEHEARKREELLSAGESVLGMLLGRRRSRPLSQASQKRRLASRARAEVKESEEVIERLKQDIAELSDEQGRVMAEVRDKWADLAEDVQESGLRPRKSDIRLKAFGLAWVPHWLLSYEDEGGNRGEARIPAYPVSQG